MENIFQLVDVIKLLLKRKKFIIALTFLVGLLSIIFSLTLDNYYKSTTTFYTASIDLSKPEKLFGNSEVDYYGSEPEINRFMAASGSVELIDHMIEKFNLYKVYNIDKSDSRSLFKARRTFNKLFELKKTKYDALQLSIEDKNKELAAEMCQEALNKLSNIVKVSIQAIQKNWIDVYQKNIDDKKVEIKEMQDTLTILRAEYGVFNVETQSETYTQLIAENESNFAKESGRLSKLKRDKFKISPDTLAMIEADLAGLASEKKALTSKQSNSSINIHKFNKGLALISILDDRIKKEENQYSYDQIKLSQIKQINSSQGDPIHLVESAEVPLIKSRPRRSILVFTATLLGFLFACFSVLLVHSLKESSLFKSA